MSTVLVTGGSGFLGGHVILKLFEGRHQVRTTMRSASQRSAIRSMLQVGTRYPEGQLRFFEADLMHDRGWDEAVAGCDYVLHVASPFPRSAPEDENELIVPARDGTLRVLTAARNAGVKRVVLTSSFAAIGYGHGATDHIFTEEDWTDIDADDVQPYMKSKTLAERAAWQFIAEEGGSLELTVINPVGIFGPTLGPRLSTSVAIIKGLIDGAMPAVPRLYFGIVDVRDLADLHVRAMLAKVANGQRFLAISGDVLSLHQVASILRRRLGASASQVPRLQFPDWAFRLMAPFNPRARAVLPQLGRMRRSTADKARRILNWQPRPPEDTIVDTANSLLIPRAVGHDTEGGV
jgi:dihydroflavonol-4-reductase